MTQQRPKVLFFDVNETLLDLSPVKENIAEVLKGKEELVSLWFTTLLHYSLVTSAGGQYFDFGDIGAATLQMVASNNNIGLSKDQAESVVKNSLRNLQPHPEVKAALTQLKEKGYKLVAFTNGSNEGLQAQMENSGLETYFDRLHSVEDAGKFKPFTSTYNFVAKEMNASPTDCMLIAAHGWDVAGAMWAGWRAAFVNRPGQQEFPLAPDSEIVGQDLKEVADILISYS